eukprot:1774986-Pleurochrysis_carterae.AAC.3
MHRTLQAGWEAGRRKRHLHRLIDARDALCGLKLADEQHILVLIVVREETQQHHRVVHAAHVPYRPVTDRQEQQRAWARDLAKEAAVIRRVAVEQVGSRCQDYCANRLPASPKGSEEHLRRAPRPLRSLSRLPSQEHEAPQRLRDRRDSLLFRCVLRGLLVVDLLIGHAIKFDHELLKKEIRCSVSQCQQSPRGIRVIKQPGFEPVQIQPDRHLLEHESSLMNRLNPKTARPTAVGTC